MRNTQTSLRYGASQNRTKPNLEAGIALVEFALVLPILLMVLIGIIDISLLFYDQAVITNASREGARAGIVLKAPKRTDSEIQTIALDYCKTYLISLGGVATPSVTVNQSTPPNFSTPLSVTVSYDYTGVLVGTVLSALTGPLTLTATSVMKNE